MLKTYYLEWRKASTINRTIELQIYRYTHTFINCSIMASTGNYFSG